MAIEALMRYPQLRSFWVHGSSGNRYHDLYRRDYSDLEGVCAAREVQHGSLQLRCHNFSPVGTYALCLVPIFERFRAASSSTVTPSYYTRPAYPTQYRSISGWVLFYLLQQILTPMNL
ncbi:hypothetical protein H0H93_008265 [Arthromyces matolae]|nr:hypothetical protein H0H93_008265 [Arthromyces matolae]